MSLTPPKYDWQHWNDAGIAVAAWVEGVFYAPYDGYIAAIGSRGAGQEDLEMRTSRGLPIQHIPARDATVDSDTLNQLQNDPMGLTIGGLLCILNQPCVENERIDINYPNGTGKYAEARPACPVLPRGMSISSSRVNQSVTGVTIFGRRLRIPSR